MEIEVMQPDEFARTREEEKGTKAKSTKSRYSKVDARTIKVFAQRWF
jgi:hypothetical protein